MSERNVRSSSTMRRRRLGAELRRLREGTGLTGDQVAERLDWYGAKVSKIETGRIAVGWGDVSDLLDLYGIEDDETRERLIALARESRRREGWWQPYSDLLSKNNRTLIDLEVSASSLRIFEPLVVPGLLQTPDYARAIITSRLEYEEKEVQRRVELRMQRQAVVAKDGSLDLWAIIDEAALHRENGGSQVMRDQLLRLAEVAEEPGVQVQVIPNRVGAHAAMSGSFGLFSFADDGDPDIAFIENVAGTLYLERKEDIAACSIAFEHLRTAAFSLPQSLDLILAAARSYEQRDGK